jgi:3-(3-hydroxy-phenyl)propionate hydroxylase
MTSTAHAHGCDYDVSIVGYGPVAATTALLLARRGLRVSIHERSIVPLELPRAVGLDGESNRLFQSIGLGREVEALLQPPREGDALWFTDSKHEKLFGTDVASHAGHNGWRDLAFFDQPELEAFLRAEVAKEEGIDRRAPKRDGALLDRLRRRVQLRPPDPGHPVDEPRLRPGLARDRHPRRRHGAPSPAAHAGL